MNALQIIAVLLAGAFVISLYVNSPKNTPHDQMPELIYPNVTNASEAMPVLSNLNNILIPSISLNASNASNATNASKAMPPFNISISFTNTYNTTVAVKIPAYAISGMPDISCNNSIFHPTPDLTVLTNNTNVYFYGCNCDYMDKARLDFDNYSTMFFVLDAGNG